MNDKLKQLFLKSGLSKRQFAIRCGIHPQNINKLLNGNFILKPNTYKRYNDRFREISKSQD